MKTAILADIKSAQERVIQSALDKGWLRLEDKNFPEIIMLISPLLYQEVKDFNYSDFKLFLESYPYEEGEAEKWDDHYLFFEIYCITY